MVSSKGFFFSFIAPSTFDQLVGQPEGSFFLLVWPPKRRKIPVKSRGFARVVKFVCDRLNEVSCAYECFFFSGIVSSTIELMTASPSEPLILLVVAVGSRRKRHFRS